MTTALLIALGLLAAVPTEPEMPRSLDGRLAIELFAVAPDIVTPTSLAVDAKGRVLVIESHSHFRPVGYKGPAADRIRVFEDTDGDGKADVGVFRPSDGNWYILNSSNGSFRGANFGLNNDVPVPAGYNP